MIFEKGQTGSKCTLGTYELYEKILRLTKANGGCSINRKYEQPNSGYMVGIKGFGSLVDMLNYKLGEGEYYGAWVNPNGVIEFDISVNVYDLRQAIEIATECNQMAIYDLNNGEDIYI